VLDATRGNPLRDSQLERVVRLILGKRAPVAVKTNKAVVACITTAKAGGDDVPRTPGAAFEFARIRQPKRRLEPEDKIENSPPESTGAKELPTVAGDAQNALAERRQAAAQVSPAAPTTPSSSTVASRGAAAKPKKKKAKTKAAETSTGVATGA
jgi:hypothetical protein